MNPETARQWLEARRTKKQLESALREVNEQIENLEIGILNQFATDGITQVKIDGATISVKNTVRAAVRYREGEGTDEGYERTCDDLIRLGLDRLVKRRFFTQSIPAWINDGGDRAILEDIMVIEDIQQLAVRNL